MSKYAWRFPRLDDGPEQGANNSGIATFKGSNLYINLAREICQNSLDAKAEGATTVRVEFKSMSLSKLDYPSLFELEQVFADCREYWKTRMEPKLERFLNEAESTLKKDSIDCLAISDYFTTGLSGAKATRQEKSKWRALTHSDGVTEKGKGSAGAHGIGKNAPFACSSLRTVFYNSYSLDDGVKAFQGVAKLITHIQNGEETIGVGFYHNTIDKIPIFEEDPCPIRDMLKRTVPGTDVLIAGFKKVPSWKEDIEKAIISNFFVAIANKTLVVKIDDIEINNNNLKDRIRFYSEKEKDLNDSEKRITTILEFYYALTEADFEVQGSIMEPNDVVLYIKKDDKYSKTIAEMRSIGMVIRTRHHNIFTRYAAVLIVKSGELNDLLKDIEPPAHDNWDPGLIEDDPDLEKNARKYRGQLISWVNRIITEKCRCEESKEYDLDGMSAYLPYDEEDSSLGTEPQDDKSPDSENKFENPSKTKPNVRKVSITAKKVKGYKDEDFDPHNHTGGGSGGGAGGNPDPDGPDKVSAPMPGNKAVNLPRILRQRITKTPKPSQYRVVFMLEKDCAKVHMAVKALGDDGYKEKLKILSYKCGRTTQIVNSEQLILSNVQGNVNNEFFVDLEYSEKMTLELLLY